MTKLMAVLAFVVTVLIAAPGFAAVQACLPNPLPGPTAPVFSRDVSRGASEQMHLDVWRVPCAGGHALLMKVTPLTQGPFLCYLRFHIVQGGAQFDLRLADATETGFCDNLLVTRTFSLVPDAPAYNPTAALTILFDTVFGTPRFAALEVAAAGVVTPPPAGPPSLLVVATGCTTCHPGQTLGFELHVTNLGAPVLVELKTGARLPGGEIVSILGRHEEETLPTGVTVIPLFSFALPGDIPAGAYAIEAALLEPELGATISRHSVALTLGP